MNFDSVLPMARHGRLYPAVILFGARLEDRQTAAMTLARALLCTAEAEARPCGRCRHCRRIAWPGNEDDLFHPDFHVLERDLRTATSVDATRKLLRGAYSSPFEARGQVFVLAEAETLSDGAADALLKVLEEPPDQSPRHFLLLAGSRLDLSTTLRSRALSIYLGAAEQLDPELVAALESELAATVDLYLETGSPVLLLRAADVLAEAPGWEDPRARQPWATAAAAVMRCAGRHAAASAARRALLDCAAGILDGWQMRLRFIPQTRILEGLLSRHLGVILTRSRGVAGTA